MKDMLDKKYVNGVGNKVRIISQKGLSSGIIIENKEIANTLKTLFDLAINSLKKKRGVKN